MTSMPLLLAGTILIYFAYEEIAEVRKFRQKAIKTEGVIVKSLKARTPKSYIPPILRFYYSTLIYALIKVPIIEYQTKEGKKYQKQIRIPIEEIGENIEVRYNPQNPTDIMVNSFYKNSKYQRYKKLVGGIVMIFASLWTGIYLLCVSY